MCLSGPGNRLGPMMTSEKFLLGAYRARVYNWDTTAISLMIIICYCDI